MSPAAAADDLATVLPDGDDRVRSVPEIGRVTATDQNFRTGGARHVGDRIDGTTWSPASVLHGPSGRGIFSGFSAAREG
jgi:hypothetical protein